MDLKSSPRKTCDLCYTRKLKCDRGKPHCSNCITYSIDCTNLVQSRKSKASPQNRARKRTNGNAGTAGRFSVAGNKAESSAFIGDFITANESGVLLHDRIPHNIGDAARSLELPPLQHTFSMLGIFLNSFNSVLPLFHADTLLSLVGECYAQSPHQRDPVSWAAINVVLALTTQLNLSENKIYSKKTHFDGAIEYLNEAQSVISQVMLGETRLLNIQVLVGIVMVLQTEHDLTAALVTISAAMRLVHKLELHNRVASAHLEPVERRQRCRVFWLAYILDKDLGLRTKQPSMQNDDDIDLELPYLSNEENVDKPGMVVTDNGKAEMNFFLKRVQLASIEGCVYDCLYSTRASKRSLEERALAKHNIISSLKDWQRSIPYQFRADGVTSNTVSNPAYNGFFCLLHSASLQCISLVNQAHGWDEKWVQSLRDQGKGMGYATLRLPPGWEELVQEARQFMVLFSQTWSSEVWFRWMASCSYLTAMVLLIANDLCNLEHREMCRDSQLIDDALLWVNERLGRDQRDREDVRTLKTVCFKVVEDVRRRRAHFLAVIQENVLDTSLPNIPWTHQI